MRLPAKAALAALAVVAGCNQFTPPTSYEAAMKSAGRAIADGKDGLAQKFCLAAFDFARKAAAGPKAITALECIAETAIRAGKQDVALPAYATVIGTYGKNLMTSSGRLRLRNNYGVALYAGGNKTEGVKQIEEALDAYGGTEYASSSVPEYPRRLLLVANLARASLATPDTAVAARVAGPLAEEIEAHVAQSSESVGLTMGAAEALAAIAELEKKRGKADRAGALLALSVERKAAEEAFAASSPARKRDCDRVAAGTAFYETCFQKIK